MLYGSLKSQLRYFDLLLGKIVHEGNFCSSACYTENAVKISKNLWPLFSPIKKPTCLIFLITCLREILCVWGTQPAWQRGGGGAKRERLPRNHAGYGWRQILLKARLPGTEWAKMAAWHCCESWCSFGKFLQWDMADSKVSLAWAIASVIIGTRIYSPRYTKALRHKRTGRRMLGACVPRRADCVRNYKELALPSYDWRKEESEHGKAFQEI